jgi:hypothetical protein
MIVRERCACRSHLGAKGVPQVVEPNLAHPSYVPCVLVALDELAPIERPAGGLVGEHQVIVVLPLALLEQPL